MQLRELIAHRSNGPANESSVELADDVDATAEPFRRPVEEVVGDLSISEISVFELPIYMSDLWDKSPYEQFPAAPGRRQSSGSLKLKWSSRGRIHNAISGGNDNVVRTLLALGADIEEVDSKGRTPLVHAAYEGREAICKLLLEKGASIDAVRDVGSTLMHNAVVKGSETVGADAAHDGDNIEEVDSEGRTPLAHAAYEGHQAICGLLLENGASRRRCTRQWDHPRAVQEGKLMAVQLLLIVGADIEEVDPKGRTPVAYAVYECQETICKLLLEKGASVESSTLYGTLGRRCISRG